MTNYGMSYLTLAVDWAGSGFGRLINAHRRGDDVIALDLARRLVKFRDRAEMKAKALGFPLAARMNRGGTGFRTSISSTSWANSMICSATRSGGPSSRLGGRSPSREATAPPGSRP